MKMNKPPIGTEICILYQMSSFFSSQTQWKLDIGGIINSVDSYFNQYVSNTALYQSTFVDGNPLNYSFDSTWLQNLFNNSQNLAILYGQLNELRLDLYPGFEGTKNFQNAAQKLPNTYNSVTCPQFRQFFEKWGTHVIDNVLYGGRFSFQLTYNMSIYQNYSIYWVTNQITIKFLQIETKYKFPGVNSSQPMDPSFAASITGLNLDLTGGKNSTFDQGLINWQKSVLLKPSMMLGSSSVTPLFTLIGDQDIRAALKEATLNYANTC